MNRALFLGTVFLAGAAMPPRYQNPVELAVSRDGASLFVVCEGSDELAVVDLRAEKVSARVPVGRVPKGIALSPDGHTAFVANSWSDTVSAINLTTLSVTNTFRTGSEPTSVLTSNDGNVLFTANRIGSNISVIDVGSGKETGRLAAGRGTSYLALSPDGRSVYATHVLPRLGAHRAQPESEITVVDAASRAVAQRLRLPSAAGVFHLALSGDGHLGIAAQLRPKNLVPLAHVDHGWAIGNAITVFGEDIGGEPVQLLLDEIDRYYAIPFGVAITRDKRTAYVSTSGSNSISVIDIQRLLGVIRAADPKMRARLANDLSRSAEFVSARIPVGANPKGLALSPDDSVLYVANQLDDSISVIDTSLRKPVQTLHLGKSEVLTPERRGARLFHTARFSFHGQFGCASCHIEETFDGLQWDLEPDGFGIDIVDNRLLEDVAETAPFKWNGGNPDLETECGPRTEKFFFRSQSFSRPELSDLISFIKSLPPRPNRFRLPNGELTPAQERGRDIFERTQTRAGKPIPEELQCPVCHSGPHYTNNSLADIGSRKSTDRSAKVDVPQLCNVALTAPYLHDGSARTLEEIWTVFNPKDTHGVTNDLTKDQLNDLIEYLKTL